MKAKVTKDKNGITGEGHTFYRLQLIPENQDDLALVLELNKNFVVWVSPNIRDKDGAVSWWGKK